MVENLKFQISNLTSNISPYAIIVAGGSGTRMQSALPKQFLLLNGLPVLMHTLQAFERSRHSPAIILVLHPGYHEYWKELCGRHNFTIPHILADGGETRFHSVKIGLDIIEDQNAVVAIQDAVRPLTSPAIIDNAFSYASANGNAVVAVQSRDSVRQLKGDTSFSLLRNEIWLVQTPQTFKIEQLRKAYLQAYSPAFTDDAGVVEHSGEKINLVDGDYQNIKITYPEDLIIAEMLLKTKAVKAI